VAALGRWGATRLHQSSVLGELLIGVAVGNLGYWLGIPFFVLTMHLGEATPLFSEVWRSGLGVAEAAERVFTASDLQAGGVGHRVLEVLTGPEGPRLAVMGVALWMFSNLGVILLLFMVGLESSVDEMLKVGVRATLVAIVGIVAPFVLGMAASAWLIPESDIPTRLFVSATLCATSVGITARVFKDLGRIQTLEAKVILGAAVIDDVLGLVILAVVVGIVVTGGVQVLEVVRILAYSIGFLALVIFAGERLAGFTGSLFTRLDPQRSKLLFPLALAFVLSWLVNQLQLATIVGAFAAGLVLSEKHFGNAAQSATPIGHLVEPLEALFAPIFFVLMGMQVNLSAFLQPGTISLALGLTVAAIVGKIVSGLPAGRALDRLSVGLGMIPRGEVGLIFASVGKGLGVVTDSLFSAIVLMVIVTTLMSPLTLKWSLARGRAHA